MNNVTLSLKHRRSFKILKRFLLDEIFDMSCLPRQMRHDLALQIADISFHDNSIYELWQIVIFISEALIEYRADDDLFFNFTQKAFSIREGWDYNV